MASGLFTMARAALGALPLIPRGDRLPDRTLVVDDLPIDRAHVAAYAAVTGLRFGDAVPLTYPFALTFPTVTGRTYRIEGKTDLGLATWTDVRAGIPGTDAVINIPDTNAVGRMYYRVGVESP